MGNDEKSFQANRNGSRKKLFELLRPDQPRSTRSGNEVLLLVLGLELVGERELGGLLLQLGKLVLVLGHLELGKKAGIRQPGYEMVHHERGATSQENSFDGRG